MPCPSIINTYSICHHTMFFHSNVVLVHQTSKRKRVIAEPEGAPAKSLKTWWCRRNQTAPTYIGCTTSDTKRRTDSSRLYPYFTGHTTSPTTQDLHSSKRYTDFICHSTSCTTEKSHSSKKYSKSTGRRPIPTAETANSCRLEPHSIYSQFKRQCFQCC